MLELQNHIINLYYKIMTKRRNYKKYLRSKFWLNKRKRFIKKYGRCQLCGEKNLTFNLHHNTYENIFREKDIDLILLCRECHKNYHKKS